VEAERQESTVQSANLNKMAYNFPRGCLAKTVENPRYEATSLKIGNDIKCMKDPVVIGKFMGIWPSEKALIWCINS